MESADSLQSAKSQASAHLVALPERFRSNLLQDESHEPFRRALGDLGVAEIEIAALMALSSVQNATAAEMSRLLDIPRLRAYATLDRLSTRGIVQSHPGRPARYFLESWETVWNALLATASRIQHLVEIARSHAPKLELAPCPARHRPVSLILRGRGVINAEIRRQVARSVVIRLVLPAHHESRVEARDFVRLIKGVAAAGRVRVHALVDGSLGIGNTQEFEVRSLCTSNEPRTLLFDETTAMVWLKRSTSRQDANEETAVLCNVREFLVPRLLAFQAAWANARSHFAFRRPVGGGCSNRI